MKLELNDRQVRSLWIACNNAQCQGIKLIRENEVLFSNQTILGAEVLSWHKETKEEFNTLQEIKDMLK